MTGYKVFTWLVPNHERVLDVMLAFVNMGGTCALYELKLASLSH